MMVTVASKGSLPVYSIMLLLVLVADGVWASTEPTDQIQRLLPEVKPRIVGGSPADANEYPTFGFNSGPVGLCGGTLIHPDIVLTAAHCESLFLDGWSQGGNSVFGDTNSKNVGVTREFPHPDYNANANFNNDIMLLKLASPLSNTPLQKVNFDPTFPLPVSS